MKPRDIAFLLVAGIFAVVFARLGVWQLSRLQERRQLNAELISRAETLPVDVSQVPADTGAAHFRRVKISGTYDFAHEIIITNRSRSGSPGVNIITPVRIDGRDTAILVNRGWIYSPDAMTVDLSKWHEPGVMSGEAYVENYFSLAGTALSPTHPRAYRWMDRKSLDQAFPYPIAPWYLVLIGDSNHTAPNVPPRVEVPPLDEGSHKSYAIQWFSFAAISIFGMILYLRRK
jgi:surfeit locus 1 family protein